MAAPRHTTPSTPPQGAFSVSHRVLRGYGPLAVFAALMLLMAILVPSKSPTRLAAGGIGSSDNQDTSALDGGTTNGATDTTVAAGAASGPTTAGAGAAAGPLGVLDLATGATQPLDGVLGRRLGNGRAVDREAPRERCVLVVPGRRQVGIAEVHDAAIGQSVGVRLRRP